MSPVPLSMRHPGTEAQRAKLRPVFSFMESRGVNASWVARQVGISRQRLHRYKTGQMRPPEEVLQRICQAVGFPRSLVPSDASLPVDAESPSRQKSPGTVRGPPATGS